VAVAAGVLLDHVGDDPAQRPGLARAPRRLLAENIQARGLRDHLPRRGAFPFEGIGRLRRVSLAGVVEVRGSSSADLSYRSGTSSPRNTCRNQPRSTSAMCQARASGPARGLCAVPADRVVDLAIAAEGSLPRPVIEAAVRAVAPGGQALLQLAAALAADPGALAAGAPPVAGRLAAELIARGSATLAVPACAACGRTGKPLFRSEDGGVCQRCRGWQLAEPCSAYGRAKPVATRTAAGQPLCEVCRRRTGRASRRCGSCGTTAPIAVRGRGGRPDICVRCYKLPEAVCAMCGRQRESNFAATGRPVCPSCSPRATATCARCGQDRPPQARWPEGPVCDPCYTAALRHRGRCASCLQQRRLVAPPGPGADTCSDCAGVPVTGACADCGIEDKLYQKGRCDQCSLRRQAAALAGPDGQVPAGLLPVLEAICAARVPKSALNWIRRSHGAVLLADLASGKLPATHEALDADPRRRAADFLRRMLTAGGVLAPRDQELARTGQWLAGVPAAVEPAAAQRIARSYAPGR
jgi:hypothetical protein